MRLAVVLAIALVARGAAADEIDDTTRKVISLDQRVHIMALEFHEAPRAGPDAALRLLVDAQVLSGMGKHDAAATACLEVMHKWSGSRAATEARFLLGDSLFELGDFRASRAHLARAVDGFTGTRLERHALMRLVDIALRTGEFDDIEGVFDRLDRVPSAAQDASVPYAKAKYRYFRGRRGQAAALFAQIPESSPYFLRARYFMATILVGQGDLGRASAAFQAITIAGSRARPAGRDATDAEVEDLARLALGRIFHAAGQIDGAVGAYRAIAAGSPSFPDALYELGWTFVRVPDLRHAHEAFEHLVRVDPSDARVPEVRLVVGSIALRLGDQDGARAAFAGARDEFEPTYRKVSDLIAGGHDLGALDVGAVVPPSMLGWVRSDPDVARLMALATDLGQMQKAVADATDALASLDHALAGPNRVALFPDLTQARQGGVHLMGALARVTEAPEVGRRIEIVSRIDAALSQLQEFDRRVDGEAGRRLGDLEARVSVERTAVEAQIANLAGVLADAEGPGGTLAQMMWRRIADRMYGVVVRSDVGLTDVAWARKDRSSVALHDLLLSQKNEIGRELDRLQRLQQAGLDALDGVDGSRALLDLP